MSSDADATAVETCEVTVKRKTPSPPPPAPAPVVVGRGSPSVDADADADAEAEDGEGEERSSSEYESGRVSCDTCGLSVSFRDEATGGFSLKEWQEHKETCAGPPAPQQAAAAPPTAVHAPAKRRRAKRTEEERKAYLGSDPYVERFEAYRVLCKSCDKWIRLRPNSTYCSIPWDAHRKSCLAKKINSKNVYALDERNALFAKDPDVRKFDAERVLCNLCDTWLPLNPDNHLFAVQTWLQHRAACQVARPAPQQLPPPPADTKPKPDPATRPPSPAQSPSFHDLNPANYTPAHESRRRNAEQRAATLRADSLIAEVEPNRVFCSLCQKWVQLRQDSSYCAYPWLQHRGKCLARHQRRAAKAAELAEAKARKLAHVNHPPHSPPPPRPARSLSAESEDDPHRESAEEFYRRHRERERDRARFLASSYKRYDHRHAPYPHPHSHHPYRQATTTSTSSSARVIRPWNPDVPTDPPAPEPRSPHTADRDVDMDAEGDDVDVDADGDRDPEMAPPSPPTHRESRPSSSHRRDLDNDWVHKAHPHFYPRRRPSFAFSPPALAPAHAHAPSASAHPQPPGHPHPQPPAHLDLDSSSGRRHFVFASIVHLRSTTYEATDEMTVSALVAYLNAAVPIDKYEDFDTAEVVRVLGALRERGRVRLEGDLVWVV